MTKLSGITFESESRPEGRGVGLASRSATLDSSDSVAGERRKLLILANERSLRRELETIFADLEVVATEASEHTLPLIRRIEPEVVLFDLGTADNSVASQNLALLRQILSLAPDTKVIAMTEQNGRELAVQAVGLGATDFYHKPINAA